MSYLDALKRIRAQVDELIVELERAPAPPSPARLLAVPATIDTAAKLCMKLAAREYGVGVNDILGRHRPKVYAWPRQVAMWLLRNTCPQATLHLIGHCFNRDHSTVSCALDAVNGRRISDSRVFEATGRLLVEVTRTLDATVRAA